MKKTDIKKKAKRIFLTFLPKSSLIFYTFPFNNIGALRKKISQSIFLPELSELSVTTLSERQRGQKDVKHALGCVEQARSADTGLSS